MNAEQKLAMIERCEKISEWREKYGDYANVMLPAVEAQQIAQIALTALTAPTADLAELVPPEMTLQDGINFVEHEGALSEAEAAMLANNACRAAILRKIEEAK
jgi:hypothetical protein